MGSEMCIRDRHRGDVQLVLQGLQKGGGHRSGLVSVQTPVDLEVQGRTAVVVQVPDEPGKKASLRPGALRVQGGEIVVKAQLPPGGPGPLVVGIEGGVYAVAASTPLSRAVSKSTSP